MLLFRGLTRFLHGFQTCCQLTPFPRRMRSAAYSHDSPGTCEDYKVLIHTHCSKMHFMPNLEDSSNTGAPAKATTSNVDICPLWMPEEGSAA